MDFVLLKDLLEIEPVENPTFVEGIHFSAKYAVDSKKAWGKFSAPKKFSLKRYNEFLAGRYCIHKALNINNSLPISDRGGPEWPPGTCGSLTHSGAYVSVMVADLKSFKGIGRDSEEILTPKLCLELENLIIDPVEKKIIKDDFEKNLTLIYSAKESLFKALYPLTQTFFDFRDAKFLDVYAQNKSFSIKLLKDLNATYKNGMVFKGNFEFSNGFAHTVILIPSE